MEYDSETNNSLKVGLLLNTTFTVFELAIGITSGSLALISDAGHNLTDSLSIVIAILGSKVSKRKANPEHSYGYGRATILTALLNSSILLGLAFYIFFEAYYRIMHPQSVSGEAIFLVALIGIIINVAIALLLKKNKNDLNVRAVFMNMAVDALALAGTLVGGFFIIVTKQSVIDPLISILIGLMLLYGAWGVLRDALHVLLEGIPEGVNVEKIKGLIKNTSSVKDVDDLHIWAISSNYSALSCHIIVEDCDIEKSTKIVRQIKEELKDKFRIEHATIETELTECPPDKK